MTYKVTFTAEIEADNPYNAAQKAREDQIDGSSLIYEVRELKGKMRKSVVDLSESPDDITETSE